MIPSTILDQHPAAAEVLPPVASVAQCKGSLSKDALLYQQHQGVNDFRGCGALHRPAPFAKRQLTDPHLNQVIFQRMSSALLGASGS